MEGLANVGLSIKHDVVTECFLLGYNWDMYFRPEIFSFPELCNLDSSEPKYT